MNFTENMQQFFISDSLILIKLIEIHQLSFFNPFISRLVKLFMRKISSSIQLNILTQNRLDVHENDLNFSNIEFVSKLIDVHEFTISTKFSRHSYPLLGFLPITSYR